MSDSKDPTPRVAGLQTGEHGAGPRVIVVGGGIAGLAAALDLHRAKVPVTLLEAAPRVGGAVGTAAVGGHVFERGPNTVPASARHVLALAEDVGLEAALLRSRDTAMRRFLWRRGALHQLPDGPRGLLGSKVLSWRGKMRLMSERWRRAPAEPVEGETFEAFMTRRVGAEAVAAVVDPFVAGVYAGRASELGAEAFPTLQALEREHGSLFKGMRARRKAAQGDGERLGPTTGLLSFEGGLGQLPAAIAKALGTRVRAGHRVQRLARETAGGPWELDVTLTETGRHLTLEADRVVLATPCWVTAELIRGHAAAAADLLAAIPTPHVASVGLGFRREDVAHDLEGFGLLVAADSPLPDDVEPVLGVLFTSSIFEGRAPEGQVSLTVMVGGSRDPEAAALGDGALVARAKHALEGLIGVRGEPTAVHVQRWHRAIPQYVPGHRGRIATVREAVEALEGLHLAGNYLDGVSLDAAAASGRGAAADALARLTA